MVIGQQNERSLLVMLTTFHNLTCRWDRISYIISFHKIYIVVQCFFPGFLVYMYRSDVQNNNHKANYVAEDANNLTTYISKNHK